MTIEVGFLELENGKCPFQEWERKLDPTVRGAVRIRINRLRLGNFGDCKAISASRGVYELKVHSGPGYRIYFGKVKTTLVILLCGGDKGTQKRDEERWLISKITKNI